MKEKREDDLKEWLQIVYQIYGQDKAPANSISDPCDNWVLPYLETIIKI